VQITPELVWIVLGIVLILAEFILPGLVVIFFGIGALVVGLLLWGGMPADGPWPFIMFSLLSVGLLVGLRGRFKKGFTGKSMVEQQSGEEDDFIGQRADVTTGFDEHLPDRGQVNYRGSLWDARAVSGTNIKTGDPVVIREQEGPVLIVGPENSAVE